jgi:hypothetical protein
MNATARFVNMEGLNHCSLTSFGNAFDGKGEPGGVCLFLPESGSVSAGGDRFGRGHPADCLYVDSLAAAAKFGLRMPEMPEGNQQAAYSAVEFVGPRGLVMAPLAAEPRAKVGGMAVLADGKSWNPLGLSSQHPYWVQWQGERWRTLGDPG